jgi:glycosyltransferase involved in cell wall biosynthesis
MIDGKSYIKYYGFQKDVNQFIANAHVCVLLSTYEAECYPLTIMDYLIHGKPVIATKNGEIDEMIKIGEEYAGFIIPIINGKPSVEETCNVIMKILENNEIIYQKSLLAIEASKKFKVENFVEQHLNLFKLLTSKNI